MQLIIDQLHLGIYSCVINQNGKIRTFTQRGVADLYDLLNSDDNFLHEAEIADKVIGKAAAALLIKGGIKSVFSEVISQSALALFNKHHIEVLYTELVPHIINRNNNGWCPLEERTAETNNIEEIYGIVDTFIKQLRAKQ